MLIEGQQYLFRSANQKRLNTYLGKNGDGQMVFRSGLQGEFAYPENQILDQIEFGNITKFNLPPITNIPNPRPVLSPSIRPIPDLAKSNNIYDLSPVGA